MKEFNPTFEFLDGQPSKEPRFVVQVSWDSADTDHTYFTTSRSASVPPVAQLSGTLDDTVKTISGQTQKINPNIATSTIGAVAVQLIDADSRAQNIFLWSEDFTNPVYASGLALGSNTIAPDGTLTAVVATDGDTIFARAIQQRVNITPDNTPYTASIFVKNGTSTKCEFHANLGVGSGTPPAESVYIDWTTSPPTATSTTTYFKFEDYGSGWWRVSVTIADNGGGFTRVLGTLYPANTATASTGSVEIWGFCCSHTPQLLPYTKTTTLAVDTTTQNIVTSIINTKLASGLGMRGKLIRIWQGYENTAFTEYELRLTYVIDSMTYKDGVYTIKAADLQRAVRSKIFTPQETTLNASVDENTLIIPTVDVDPAMFPAVAHGSEWTVRPGESVAYVKLDKEVIAHQGGLTFDATNGWHLTAIERGALNTAASAHNVQAGTEDNRKPKIREHIYIEGPSPKIMYALLTGQLLNAVPFTLPAHWHLGIDVALIRLTDFQNIGPDFWNTANDHGRFVRIENPGAQDGKRFIEKEMLLWMGGFMPVYSNGQLGLRRLAGVLSDSAHQGTLDIHNVISYGDLSHDMRSVINDIRVQWNWVDAKKEFTKENLFIDQASINIHGRADEKIFRFKAVHTGLHTDEDLLSYFDVLRDRYSGPPLELSLSVDPGLGSVEVGDTLRVDLPQIRDLNTATALYRTFEVQQVSTDWMTGALSLSLFASSRKAGVLARTALSSILLDSYYTSVGTDLSTVLTIVSGAVTTNGTLTGDSTDIDAAPAVYYYSGNLTINSGVTVSITQNVQLRIRGSLQVNGVISGVGAGATGGAATTTFTDLSTVDNFNNLILLAPAYDKGQQGFFGTTIPPAGLHASGTGTPGGGGVNAGDRIGTQRAITVDKGPFKVGGFTFNTSEGSASIPFYQLTNDQQTNTLAGYGPDLRGNSGSGGVPFIRTVGGGLFSSGVSTILANGGAGGNGGAGLLIVARGMAFGGAGSINLSGGDSSPGGGVTNSGKTIYAGSGAPGAPGALLILLDGAVTNPDITANTFIANYGAVGTVAGATKLALYPDDGAAPPVPGVNQFISNQFGSYWQNYTITDWPHTNGTYVGPPHDGLHDVSAFGAAHRIQFIPKDETPVFQNQDEVLFDPIPAWGYQESNIITDAAPIPNDKFGSSSAVSDDGSRLFIGASELVGSAGTPRVEVVRNVDNIVREQTINGAGDFGLEVVISGDADRFVTADSTLTSSTGAVYVYSRAASVWSLEQTIGTAATPSTFDAFGFQVASNKVMDALLIQGKDLLLSGSGRRIEYWTRSGTVWSHHSNLPVSTTMDNSTRDHIAMSGDGNFAMNGDSTSAPIGGTAGAGIVEIHQWNGTAWSKVASLTPDDTAAYGWGRDGAAMNYDGSVIVTAGAATAKGKFAVYHRVGTVYNLIQVSDTPEVGPSTSIARARLSDDGLRLAMFDNATETVYVYRRANKAQAFTEFQAMPKLDTATGSSANAEIGFARSGKFLTTAEYNRDVAGVTSAGAVRVWKVLGL